MMLIAKYVKVFSRTGTQLFPFACHVGDRPRVAISKVCVQFPAHWRHDHLKAALSYR